MNNKLVQLKDLNTIYEIFEKNNDKSVCLYVNCSECPFREWTLCPDGLY